MINFLSRLRHLFKHSDPMEQELVGIDMSHGYIRICQLKKTKDSWSLEKISSKVISSESDSEEFKNRETSKLIKLLRLEQKIQTDQAAVSLPMSNAIVQIVNIPILGDEELKIAIDNGSLWESAVTVPGDLSEYSIFWQVIKKMPEKNLMSILFVASKII